MKLIEGNSRAPFERGEVFRTGGPQYREGLESPLSLIGDLPDPEVPSGEPYALDTPSGDSHEE